MSKSVSGLTGTTDTLTDEEWTDSNAASTPAAVLAFGVARLVTVREAMRARPLVWDSVMTIDATQAGMERLENQANALARAQLGYTLRDTSTVAITAEIASTTMTVTVTAGPLYSGMAISGGTVDAGTTIRRQITGEPGGTGTYEVSISQTEGSGSLSASGWHMTYFLPGDGVPLDMEGADGAPMTTDGSPGPPYGVNANNLLDAANSAFRYVRDLMEDWRVLYLALVAAYETIGTDQNKIDAMKVVIDSFDDTGNWPSTAIST